MIVTALKTTIIKPRDDLNKILEDCLPRLRNRDIVIISTKIVSVCQGSLVKNDGKVKKLDLIHQEAEYYIDDPLLSRYHVTLTIKEGILIANSGIDESNGNGYFILWPENIHQVTAEIWQFLKDKYGFRDLGVILVDSRLIPLRWGTLGIGVSWCGFEPLNNYIGRPDIFGKKLRVTKLNVLDGLAASAVVAMGEGNEQTPLVVISDAGFINFTSRRPTTTEIKSLKIKLKDDIYAPLTNSSKWRRGGSNI